MEHESAGERLVGQHTLTTEQKLVGERAGKAVENGGRHPQESGSAQGTTQLPAEFCIRRRRRRGRIERAGQ